MSETPLHKCSSPYCPGFWYRASERAHPPDVCTDGPRCDGVSGCFEPVAYVDTKGFAYCDAHGGSLKRAGRAMRKLTTPEIDRLKRGLTISYHRKLTRHDPNNQSKH